MVVVVDGFVACSGDRLAVGGAGGVALPSGRRHVEILVAMVIKHNKVVRCVCSSSECLGGGDGDSTGASGGAQAAIWRESGKAQDDQD